MGSVIYLLIENVSGNVCIYVVYIVGGKQCFCIYGLKPGI